MKLALVVCLACSAVAVVIGFLQPSKPDVALDWQPPSIDMSLLEPTRSAPILLEPAGLTHEFIARLGVKNREMDQSIVELQKHSAEMDYVINELKKGFDK